MPLGLLLVIRFLLAPSLLLVLGLLYVPRSPFWILLFIAGFELRAKTRSNIFNLLKAASPNLSEVTYLCNLFRVTHP